jgi:hypothetical protein
MHEQPRGIHVGPKGPTSHRLSEACKRDLRALARHWHLSGTAVLELLVRRAAREEGVGSQRGGAWDGKG